MENTVRFVVCEGLQIAAYLEAKSIEPHSAYYPLSVLFYSQKGQLNIKIEEKLYTIPSDSFAFIRKHTRGTYFKTWTEEEGYAVMYAFAFQDRFIQQAIKEFDYKPRKIKSREPVLILKDNTILRGFFRGIISYIHDNEEVDSGIVALKTREAIMGIVKENPDYINVFHDFSYPEKANLEEFMLHNFQHNFSLKDFAEMSGRSLSTFNREFRTLFNEPPHRWIMKQRLNKARELLILTEKRPSEIYLELGFEDLAHFSRSFKKEFGKTPTDIKKTGN